MIMDKNENRRKHDRRPTFIIVEYTVAEGSFRDILKSVGADGLFVNTKRAIAAGQSISLRFPLFDFDAPVEASGSVVRSGPQGFAVALDQPIQELLGHQKRLSDIVHEIDRDNPGRMRKHRSPRCASSGCDHGVFKGRLVPRRSRVL